MLAVYIHWPFCKAKCPYCDFNSHVNPHANTAKFITALKRDLHHAATLTGQREVGSIFFGGGTPSLMPPAGVADLIATVADLWTLAPNAEITLEANPTSVEAKNFADLAAHGVNRLSLGIQSLREEGLRFLGREHSVVQALAAIELARQVFKRYSFDLIYALPKQPLSAWQEELSQALALAGDHLSLYQLTIEEGTPFYLAYQRGDFAMPDEETAAGFYELTETLIGRAGFRAYEVSNYARPGGECRHNLAYWHYDDYVGVGAGAHGRITINGQKHLTRQHRAPDIWLRRVQEGGHGLHPLLPIDAALETRERLLMGLRVSDGLAVTSLPLPPPAKNLAPLLEHGLITNRSGVLQTTPRGRLVLNSVTAQLLKHLPRETSVGQGTAPAPLNP